MNLFFCCRRNHANLVTDRADYSERDALWCKIKFTTVFAMIGAGSCLTASALCNYVISSCFPKFPSDPMQETIEKTILAITGTITSAMHGYRFAEKQLDKKHQD